VGVDAVTVYAPAIPAELGVNVLGILTVVPIGNAVPLENVINPRPAPETVPEVVCVKLSNVFPSENVTAVVLHVNTVKLEFTRVRVLLVVKGKNPERVTMLPTGKIPVYVVALVNVTVPIPPVRVNVPPTPMLVMKDVGVTFCIEMPVATG